MQGGIVAVMRRKGGAVGEEEVEEVGGGGHKGEEDEDAPAGRGGRPRFWLGGGQGKHGAGGWVVEMEMLAPFVGHIVPAPVDRPSALFVQHCRQRGRATTVMPSRAANSQQYSVTVMFHHTPGAIWGAFFLSSDVDCRDNRPAPRDGVPHGQRAQRNKLNCEGAKGGRKGGGRVAQAGTTSCHPVVLSIIHRRSIRHARHLKRDPEMAHTSAIAGH